MKVRCCMNPRITLKRAVDKFPDYILLKGNTKSTAQSYLCDLSQFYGFMSVKYPNVVYVDMLNRNHVMDYLLALQRQVKNKKYRRSTFDRKSDSLIVFSKYLFEMGYLSVNLLNDYSYKRVKSHYVPDWENDFKPYVFSEDEIAELLNIIINSTDKNKFRDLAIFSMLIQLGIRRETLLVSTWEDIDFIKHEMILHHAKDKNTTKVKITEELITVLENYQFVSKRKTGRIFVSNKGTPLSYSAYNDIIRKYLKKIGAYQKGATGHSFRHTFITNALRKNINPEKIILYTGHRDISSLEPYKHFVPPDLTDVCVAVSIPLLSCLTKTKNKVNNQ